MAAAAAAGNDKSDDDEASEGELDEDQLEAKKAAEYFEDGDDGHASPGGGDASSGGVPFQQLNISRPLLRAVEAMGYVTPTPVQQRAVPFALAGRYVRTGVSWMFWGWGWVVPWLRLVNIEPRVLFCIIGDIQRWGGCGTGTPVRGWCIFSQIACCACLDMQRFGGGKRTPLAA